jgi:hypothetical protein
MMDGRGKSEDCQYQTTVCRMVVPAKCATTMLIDPGDAPGPPDDSRANLGVTSLR